MSSFDNIPEYEVSQFNKAIKELIENNFNYVRIKGEISEIKTATKGQLYITLKDKESIISGVIWEQKKRYLKFQPELGMEIIVTGKITLWSKYKTTYQIDIDKLELAGEGALLKLIEDRKNKLKEKGIFNQEYKKLIPFIPKKIGVITSPTGSVIHDIINRIKDRFEVDIDLWPVAVQGADAANMIIQAIQGFNNMTKIDKPETIIIARGGGSTEDLMAFNDENLALAVFNSEIPIISAVGHETDNTILDFVSDLRVSTPTAAAEKVVPVRSELVQIILSFEQRLNLYLHSKIKSEKNYFENMRKFLKEPTTVISSFREKLNRSYIDLKNEIESKYEKKYLLLHQNAKLFKPPESKINLFKYEVEVLEKNLFSYTKEKINHTKNNLFKFSRLLKSNSISSNLKKGYSILTKNKKIIKDSKNLSFNDKINAKLEKSKLELVLKKITKN